MVGIYKITNKLNNKAYIGQSVHCGKRLDEHYKGNQLIDDVIRQDGIVNFTFEILKEVNKEDLSYWEDYYIMKYNTLFPNGYNKKWNCNNKVRNKIKEQMQLDNDIGLENDLADILGSKEYIRYPDGERELKNLKYGDVIYAWLLIHSVYSESTDCFFVNKKVCAFTNIAKDIGRSRQTVSKRIKELLKIGMIKEDMENGGYLIPTFINFQRIDCEVIYKLIFLSSTDSQKEELIKTFVWLRRRFLDDNKKISYTDLIKAFGHSRGNEETYDRYKDILTTLQDAGLIKFRTDFSNYRGINGMYEKTLYIYQINDGHEKIG